MSKYKIKNIFIIAISLVILVLFSQNIIALGVAPAWKDIEFKPNSVHEITLRIINNNNEDMKILLQAEGDLEKYVTFEKNIIIVKADEKEKLFTYKVKLPETLERAGDHVTNIVLLQLPSDTQTEGKVIINEEGKIQILEESLIKSSKAVISKLIVKVPYPEKYLEAKLYVSEVNVNETAEFNIALFNLGEKDINKIKGKISIYDIKGNKIGSTETNEISLKAKSEGKVIASWLANAPAGPYIAKAEILYDEKKTSAEENFFVGNLKIEIIALTIDYFKLGDIAKFGIFLENKWNQDIENVYGIFKVQKEDKELYSYKTSSIDMQALGTGKLDAYWNTKDIIPGVYELLVKVYYKNKETTAKYKAKIDMKNIEIIGGSGYAISEQGKNNNWMIILIILFIITNILLYLKIRKRYKKNE